MRAGKREAQRVLNEMITEAERGLAVRRNATVGELLEAWFEMASGDFSPSTVKETRGLHRPQSAADARRGTAVEVAGE